MRATPSDLAKWAFWVPLRSTMDPGRQLQVQSMAAAWRLQWMTAGRQRAIMEEEYRKWLGSRLTDRGYATLIRDAYRASFRTHLEELLLGKLNKKNIDQWVELKGIENIKDALSINKGAIWVYPHAGPIMLMIAALAYRDFHYTQYAARGLAPPDIAEAHPELLAHNHLRDAVRRAREANENQLPVEFLTLDEPVRTLHRHLNENRIVGLAFDGRIGSGWFPTPFLNRTALLSTGPWKLACSTGAPVLPVFCHTPVGQPACIEVGEPISSGPDWKNLAQNTIAEHERWLQQHPEEYGTWLLHTRERSNIDDHPLFIDTAQDDRHLRWMPDEKPQLR